MSNLVAKEEKYPLSIANHFTKGWIPSDTIQHNFLMWSHASWMQTRLYNEKRKRQRGKWMTDSQYVFLSASSSTVSSSPSFWPWALSGTQPIPLPFFFDCRFERGSDQGADMFFSRPVLPIPTSATNISSGDVVSLRSITTWLERMLAALDCYSWTFGLNLLTAAQLLMGELEFQQLNTSCVLAPNIEIST